MAGIGALVDAMDRQAEEAEAAALAADAAAEAAIEAQLPVMHPHEGQQFWYIGIHVKYRRIDDAAMQEAVAAKARLRMAGLCSVCLEEQQVVGAEYLHGTASYCASEAYRDATAVHDSTHVACEGCLAKYFTAIVAEGYNGVCPRMKCPFCPLVVPEMRWSALVEPETSRLVRQRAAILLTLQCSSCHTRCSLMEFAHYSAGSADFEKALPGALAADLSLFEAGAISATVFLERIAAAVDGDIAQPCAVTAEHDPELNYVVPETTTRVWALMREVFKCIQDWERRAVLHSRFLSLHPVVQTPCCMAVHCYRCRVGHVHHGQTCAEYQAATYPSEELVATCPNCGIYIVKNDGCSSVSCVCGHGFCFESRLQELGLLHTEVPPEPGAELVRETSGPAVDHDAHAAADAAAAAAADTDAIPAAAAAAADDAAGAAAAATAAAAGNTAAADMADTTGALAAAAAAATAAAAAAAATNVAVAAAFNAATAAGAADVGAVNGGGRRQRRRRRHTR